MENIHYVSKDGPMDHEAGTLSGFHDPESGGLYGTAEGDRLEGSHAPEMRVVQSLTHITQRGAPLDETEKWLMANDPDYTAVKDWE